MFQYFHKALAAASSWKKWHTYFFSLLWLCYFIKVMLKRRNCAPVSVQSVVLYSICRPVPPQRHQSMSEIRHCIHTHYLDSVSVWSGWMGLSWWMFGLIKVWHLPLHCLLTVSVCFVCICMCLCYCYYIMTWSLLKGSRHTIRPPPSSSRLVFFPLLCHYSAAD